MLVSDLPQTMAKFDVHLKNDFGSCRKTIFIIGGKNFFSGHLRRTVELVSNEFLKISIQSFFFGIHEKHHYINFKIFVHFLLLKKQFFCPILKSATSFNLDKDRIMNFNFECIGGFL